MIIFPYWHTSIFFQPCNQIFILKKGNSILEIRAPTSWQWALDKKANQAKKLHMKGSFLKSKLMTKCENICSAQDQGFAETALAPPDLWQLWLGGARNKSLHYMAELCIHKHSICASIDIHYIALHYINTLNLWITWQNYVYI